MLKKPEQTIAFVTRFAHKECIQRIKDSDVNSLTYQLYLCE
ncbi:hypothetical protein [Calothrix sp. 336/3]|nr:hypothetical protein [Calothrix sp. 336/3]